MHLPTIHEDSIVVSSLKQSSFSIGQSSALYTQRDGLNSGHHLAGSIFGPSGLGLVLHYGAAMHALPLQYKTNYYKD
jgi:hypothetical protein